MHELILLAGVALCVISVIAAIISVLRTQPPRGAAILLLLGIAAIVAAGWMAPGPFRIEDIIPSIQQGWARLRG